MARERQRGRDLPRPGRRQRAGAVRRPRLVFLLACLPSCFPWLAFGAALQRLLRSDRAFRIFNAAMGALLAASVGLFLR